ncbi:MAG: hypothetical protein WCD44_02500, partial [Candidatus Babeliales bacterium]
MNLMKKGLCLSLFLLTIGGGKALQAYTVRIKNATPYTISYAIDIVAGKDEKGTIPSGHIGSVNTVGYLNRGIRVEVLEKPTSGFVDPLYARDKERVFRIPKSNLYYYAPGVGNANYIVAGPYW